MVFALYKSSFSGMELGRGNLETREFRLTSILYYLILLCIVYYYSIVKGKNNRPDLIYLGVFSLALLLAGTAFFEILYRYRAHFIIPYLYIIKDSLLNMKKDMIIMSIFLFFLAYIPTSKFLVVTDTHPIFDYYSVFDSDKSEMNKKIKNGKLPLFID